MDQFSRRLNQQLNQPSVTSNTSIAVASAKRNGYSNAGFAALIGKYDFTRGSEITQKAYPQLWREACDRIPQSLRIE